MSIQRHPGAAIVLACGANSPARVTPSATIVRKGRIKGYHLLSYELIISAAYVSLRAFVATLKAGPLQDFSPVTGLLRLSRK